MYNRYIPQPDGSYRRNKVQEPQRRPSPNPPTPPQNHPSPPHPQPPPCPPSSQEQPRQHCTHKPPPCRESDSISGFFKNLLPRDLDTGDLLIILLLLLMAGDCEKDRNTALLTLALYFFM